MSDGILERVEGKVDTLLERTAHMEPRPTPDPDPPPPPPPPPPDGVAWRGAWPSVGPGHHTISLPELPQEWGDWVLGLTVACGELAEGRYTVAQIVSGSSQGWPAHLQWNRQGRRSVLVIVTEPGSEAWRAPIALGHARTRIVIESRSGRLQCTATREDGRVAEMVDHGVHAVWSGMSGTRLEFGAGPGALREGFLQSDAINVEHVSFEVWAP